MPLEPCLVVPAKSMHHDLGDAGEHVLGCTEGIAPHMTRWACPEKRRENISAKAIDTDFELRARLVRLYYQTGTSLHRPSRSRERTAPRTDCDSVAWANAAQAQFVILSC